MLYSYTIIGRTEGNPKQEEYTGLVDAKRPKEACLLALASEFGVPESQVGMSGTVTEMAFRRLDGWADDIPDLTDQWLRLDDDDTRFTCTSGEFGFIIDVEEAKELTVNTCDTPQWIVDFIDRIVSDVNFHYTKSITTKAFEVEEYVPGMNPFNGRSGQGMIAYFKMKDLVINSVDMYSVVFNLTTGYAFLSNGYNRVGKQYRIKIGATIGEFAE